MYMEITSDEKKPLVEAARKQIESGVPCLMTLRQWGDFYKLSINEGCEEPPLDESPPARTVHGL
jgi:hypothetical protein